MHLTLYYINKKINYEVNLHMADLKIITHAIYETPDGREFDDVQEAQDWMQTLEDIKGITMLDSKFMPTTDITEVFYAHIKNHAQLRAFEAMSDYEGLYARIADLGCWYYDENTDAFVNLETEINRLKDIQYKIYTKGE